MELDTIVDLDSIAISSQIAPDTNCHVFCAFDTTAYHGFVSNSIIFGCNLIETGWRFTKALGKTEIIQNDYDPFAGISETKTDVLIYYNNGTTIIGKPYYTYTSIQNISSMGLLNVWPNPFHSSLFLDIRSIKEDGTITIYNILGQSIYQKELRNSNTDPQILDLSLLQVGVYTLQIQTSKGNFIEKITKQ